MTVRAQWMGDQIKGDMRRSAAAGLLAGAKAIGEKSTEIAPHEFGELESAIYSDVDPASLIAIVGYDVPRDIKAIKQHEDLSYRHPAGEGPKFLERPVKAGARTLEAKLAEQLRRLFG